MEWAGVTLVATAAGFIHVALAIGVVGVYLFISAILAQVIGGDDGSTKAE